MYIHVVYIIDMLLDKMATSHSHHLFVSVAFAFCFLSLLIHATNSHDYTDSRQFEKNPVVSRHRNNIQRLPNYNWKPPDKYYGPRKDSTKRNMGMEFTKPVDSEQRMADPWIKKMQEISRQEREKWAAYRRNVKLTLDNVEETTKAGKLTNNESITMLSKLSPILSRSGKYYENIKEDPKVPIKLFEESESSKASEKMLSKLSPILSRSGKYYENIKEDPKVSIKLFEESESSKASEELVPVTLKSLIQHLSANQNNTNVKDKSSSNRYHSSWSNSKQYMDTNVDRASNKKPKSDKQSTDIKNSSEKFFQEASHQRHKDYKMSDIKEDLFFKRNATTDYVKSKLEESHLSSINLYPKQSISQQFKDSHILKSTSKNFTKSSENDKSLNRTNGFKESPTKKYSRQFIFSQNNKENRNDDKEIEKTIANLLIRKSEKNDNVNSHNSEELVLQQSKIPHVSKNLKKMPETIHNLNHKIDFKVPMKKYSRQSNLSQNNNEENNDDDKKDDENSVVAKSSMWKSKEKKHDMGGKDVTEKLNHEKSVHSGRWGMSVSSPPVEFLKDMSRRPMHRKNGEQIEKDGKQHSFGQWGMSVVSPPKEFFEDISMHGDRSAEKTGSRPNKIKGFSNHRPPIHQSHRNVQTTLPQQLTTDEHNKKLVRTLLGKVPNGLYDSKSPGSNYFNNYPTNTDLNNSLFLGFLQALQYIWQDDIDISMSCRMRNPYALSRI